MAMATMVIGMVVVGGLWGCHHRKKQHARIRVLGQTIEGLLPQEVVDEAQARAMAAEYARSLPGQCV